MGLGKTLQIITLLEHTRLTATERTDGGHPVSLIICPSSLVYNWDSEIEHFFCCYKKTLLITGTAQERQDLLTHAADYDVLITSYDMLKRDITYYDALHFQYQIIDEHNT